MREYMRNNDRAMSNLEALPGGFNALRQLYENVQEPLMNASQADNGGGGSSGAGDNPLAGMMSALGLSGAAAAGTAGGQAGAGAAGGAPGSGSNPEGMQPLPNPWAAGGGASGKLGFICFVACSSAPGGSVPYILHVKQGQGCIVAVSVRQCFPSCVLAFAGTGAGGAQAPMAFPAGLPALGGMPAMDPALQSSMVQQVGCAHAELMLFCRHSEQRRHLPGCGAGCVLAACRFL